ncbi:MAG: ribonuclease P protein component [Flavobacteriales bacterium]|nr:ribonuclease P protein component [Flavobacteriales bacterium]
MLDKRKRATFKKSERLKSKKLISEVFKKNQTFRQDSVRLFWMNAEIDSDYPVQICISIPKRNVKKAVHRNTIKRKIKEAYRKNKSILYDYLEPKGVKCALMLIYLDNNVPTYEHVERKIVLTLERLVVEHEKNT